MSALNRALLLLSKIDNQQFGATHPVHLSALICQTVEEYEFMAEHKGLHVQLLMLDDVDVSANDHLITVLIRNLIRNALTHTPAVGTITIRLVSRSLQIENTQSLGLGLAIVKSIGDTYEFTPRITQAENRFIFSIQF